MRSKRQLTLLNYASILSIFLFAGAGSFMNAAVQTMMEAWPQLAPSTVRMVTSLPSLVALPVTIWAGAAVGKRFSFRLFSIAGTAMILIGGVGPFFLHATWTMVLVCRAVVGVGVGLIAVRNSLILRLVPEEKQASIIGYGSALFNAGGMLAGPVVGILCTRGWQYSFLYDLLAAVPLLIMIFGLKEPGQETEENTAAKMTGDVPVKTAAEEKQPWDRRLTAYVILQFVGTMALYPLLSGMSTYMHAAGIGTAFLAGLAVSSYNVGGVVVNLVLNPLLALLGKKALPVLHLLFAAGMAVVVFFPTVPGVFAGCVICGICFNTLMSVFQLYNGQVGTPKQATFISSVLIAVLGLGNFVSVYYISACHAVFHRISDIHSTYLGTLLVYLILAGICMIGRFAPDDTQNKQGDD